MRAEGHDGTEASDGNHSPAVLGRHVEKDANAVAPLGQPLDHGLEDEAAEDAGDDGTDVGPDDDGKNALPDAEQESGKEGEDDARIYAYCDKFFSQDDVEWNVFEMEQLVQDTKFQNASIK